MRHETTRRRLTCSLTLSEADSRLNSPSDLFWPASSAAWTTCATLRSESAARLVPGSTSDLIPSGPQLVDIMCDSK